MEIKGSFIQDWFYENFDDARWMEECATMKACGIDLLIAAEQFDNPEKIRRILRAAARNHIQICVGTGPYTDWWKTGSVNPAIVPYFKDTTAKLAAVYEQLTEEEKSALFGFYFVPEISSTATIGYSKYLVQALNLIIDVLKCLNPELPLLLSPYYSEYYGAKSIAGYEKDWVKLLQEVHFRPQDILCPQDAIGALWTKKEHLNQALSAYQDAIRESGTPIRFWVNCENFISCHEGGPLAPKRTENRGFYPAPVKRFAWQLEQAKQYTDTIITFSYNHYYSPKSVHPDYDRALRQFLSTERCQDNAFSMSEGKIEKQDGKWVFAFAPVQSDWAVQCVRVYRLDAQGRRQFAGRCDRPMSPDASLPACVELERTSSGAYIALAEDVWGNESAPFAFRI